jgi:hypothetical protein
MKTYYKKYKHKFAQYGRDLRDRVLAAYGGKCACCGESTPEFLAIDHTLNDGASHRKEIGSGGRSIYRWLEANNFPQDRFRLLCHNCNQSRGFYGGCPHEGPVPGKSQRLPRWNGEKSRTPSIGCIE